MSDAYDVEAEREAMAQAIMFGDYTGVTLVEHPDPQPNAQHGRNTPDEMDPAG